MPVYINALGTATPTNRFAQSHIAEFMVRAMNLDGADARKLRAIHRASGIKYRHSVIEDYGKEKEFTFYDSEEKFSASTSKRMKLYREHAAELSERAINNCLKQTNSGAGSITHLICVSCTGMYAPGLDIDLVQALSLNSNVNRIGINFMGCYAAITAIKLANAICKSDERAKVLIVCTELCSIHFQNENTEDNLLANALFADGAAAVLISSEKTRQTQLSVDCFYSEIVADGAKDMAWYIGNTGFEMKLSSYIPKIIGSGIEKFIEQLYQSNGLREQKIDYFAIHPGGKKILENIERALNISKDDNQYAYKVLEQYGNMSSPTVLFVIDTLLKDMSKVEKGKNVLTLAFGPGITMESMLLKTV